MLGELTALPTPASWNKGVLILREEEGCRERGEEREGRERGRKGGDRKGRRGRKGKGRDGKRREEGERRRGEEEREGKTITMLVFFRRRWFCRRRTHRCRQRFWLGTAVCRNEFLIPIPMWRLPFPFLLAVLHIFITIHQFHRSQHCRRHSWLEQAQV